MTSPIKSVEVNMIFKSFTDVAPVNSANVLSYISQPNPAGLVPPPVKL